MTDGTNGHGTSGNGASSADESLHFGWLATDVARLMRTVFDRRVRTLGLTRPQWLALVRLSRRPGASQSELADMMEIEKAPAGRIVDRMEEKGWVERRPDPADRRVNRIYLTDRGQRVFAAILPISIDTVHDALSNLSQSDRTRLVALLSNVKSTLQALAESDPAPDIDWADEDSENSDRASPDSQAI
jgi:DNA-binding MarR family transcriptional regulator